MQVRFHVTSNHKLRRCEDDTTILSSIHHLNMEQLTKCLASLYNLYDINRTSDSVFDNEAEFRSLYVLLHLETHSHSTVALFFIAVIWLSHFSALVWKYWLWIQLLISSVGWVSIFVVLSPIFIYYLLKGDVLCAESIKVL